MATMAQLQAEDCWQDEVSAPRLVELGQRVRAHYGLAAEAIGIRGDENHLRGYHRSARWVKESRYATSRTYSVSENPGNKAPADSNWACALDITPKTSANMLAMSRRIDTAVRSGGLEEVTEWYGNLDGDQRVDGYDNIRNAVATSDDSHLWHLHLSFDRAAVAQLDVTKLFSVLTGEDAVTTSEIVDGVWGRPTPQQAAITFAMPDVSVDTNGVVTVKPNTGLTTGTTQTYGFLYAVAAAKAAGEAVRLLNTASHDVVSADEVAAKLASNTAFIQAIAAAVASQLRELRFTAS